MTNDQTSVVSNQLLRSALWIFINFLILSFLDVLFAEHVYFLLNAVIAIGFATIEYLISKRKQTK